MSEIEDRLSRIEQRLDSLEHEMLPYRRIGPRPEELEPDPEVVERLVEKAKEAIAAQEVPPVDRSKRCMTDGSPELPREEYTQIDPATGQQKGYVALCPTERAKGFVRPVRQSYKHLRCGCVTTMGIALAETYARDPGFYSGTFCCYCRSHFPLDQFVWEGTQEKVGS